MRFIEITRYKPMDDNGYTVWVRILEGDPKGDYNEIRENIFGTKKDAYAWAKKQSPKARIYYTTEFARR